MENLMDIIQDIIGDTEKSAASQQTQFNGGDKTEPATTGSHDSEQSSTIKRTSTHTTVDSETEVGDEGSGNGVNTPVLSMGGVNATETGKDVPATTQETPETDAGTSHPVKSASDLTGAANEILAAIAVLTKSASDEGVDDKGADEEEVEKIVEDASEDKSEEKEASATPDLDFLLGALAGQDFAKQAATDAATQLTDQDYIKMAHEEMQLTVKSAEAAADSLISFLVGAAEGISKEAMDELAAASVEPEALGAGGEGEELDPETEALLMELLAAEGGEEGLGEEAIGMEEIAGAPAEAPAEEEIDDAAAADVVTEGGSEEEYEEDTSEKVSAAVAKMDDATVNALAKAIATRISSK